MIKRRKGNPEERFWNSVEIRNDDECWIWKNYCSAKGYGQFHVINDDRTSTHWQAHRFAWSVKYGEIPEGLLVCHHCDNPGCINPKHLFLGTNQDNMNDRNNKGRQAKPKGSKNGFSKLTENQVIEIKMLISSRRFIYPEIAKMFDVSRSTIGAIASGQNWSWLDRT